MPIEKERLIDAADLFYTQIYESNNKQMKEQLKKLEKQTIELENKVGNSYNYLFRDITSTIKNIENLTSTNSTSDSYDDLLQAIPQSFTDHKKTIHYIEPPPNIDLSL